MTPRQQAAANAREAAVRAWEASARAALCAHCGGEFEAVGHQRYCSNTCRQCAYQKRTRARRRQGPEENDR